MKRKYGRVYQFKIALKGINPPYWARNTSSRNLYVRGEVHFHDPDERWKTAFA